MKLKEVLDVMVTGQFVDVYYKDNNVSVKCASYNNAELIEEKYYDAEVQTISVTKYNTLDILIEKPAMNKRYTVKFEIPSWLDFDEEVDIEFEDDEDEDEIQERLEDEFKDWLEAKLRELGDEAYKEVIEVEEY